jgi:hypothetical protein
MGKDHAEEITVPRPIDDAYAQAVSAPEAFPRAKLKEADEQARRVELKVGMSFKSWGERVTIELAPEGDGATRAEIGSRASLGTTMVDYGKNYDNVQRVKDWLGGTGRSSA